MESNLKVLSKGRSGKLLLEVCEEVKRRVADVRNPIKAKLEIQNEVRLAVIEVIDSMLVEKIKVLSGEVSPPNKNEFI